MTEDQSLFGDEPQPTAEVAPKINPIAGWQVDLLRKALDARGLTSMPERQQVIESAVGRAVESLRALSHEEGIQILSRLGQQSASGRAQKSAWDDREEDTWIDRL